MPGLCTIEEAIEDLQQGKMIILVDDADRENGGDLVMSAEKVTPEAIAFMAKTGGGLTCPVRSCIGEFVGLWGTTGAQPLALGPRRQANR